MLKRIFLIGILIIWQIILYAQVAITSSGGIGASNTLKASYTVGQIFYLTKTGTDGNILLEGVQQAFLITDLEENPNFDDTNFNITVYPNPTNNFLIVKVENYDIKNLLYVIFDLSGKKLQQVKSYGTKTEINFSIYPASSYILKVIEKNKVLKVFKIIKY